MHNPSFLAESLMFCASCTEPGMARYLYQSDPRYGPCRSGGPLIVGATDCANALR